MPVFAQRFDFSSARNGFRHAFAPRKPRRPWMRVLLGLIGVAVLLALVFVSVFVGIAMLTVGVAFKLLKQRGEVRPARGATTSTPSTVVQAPQARACPPHERRDRSHLLAAVRVVARCAPRWRMSDVVAPRRNRASRFAPANLPSDRTFPVHRIYCVGRNFADHAREMGAAVPACRARHPRPSSSSPRMPSSSTARCPTRRGTRELHHEVELVVALGRDAPPACSPWPTTRAAGLRLRRGPRPAPAATCKPRRRPRACRGTRARPSTHAAPIGDHRARRAKSAISRAHALAAGQRRDRQHGALSRPDLDRCQRNPPRALEAVRAPRRRPRVHGHAGGRRPAAAGRHASKPGLDDVINSYDRSPRPPALPLTSARRYRRCERRHYPSSSAKPTHGTSVARVQGIRVAGSFVDLAVGVVIGGAFGKIVTALVDGIVMPAVSRPPAVPASRLEIRDPACPATTGPAKESRGTGDPLRRLRREPSSSFVLIALVIFAVLPRGHRPPSARRPRRRRCRRTSCAARSGTATSRLTRSIPSSSSAQREVEG